MTVGFPTAKALSTDRLQKTISQTAHGFGVGDIVINDALAGPPDYITAKANSLANCQGAMMVSRVINANTFVVTQCGYVTAITEQTVTAGVTYYLSPTILSSLTTIRPSAVGDVIFACFVADSTTSGFYYGGFGQLIEPDGPSNFTVTTAASVNMSVNAAYASNYAGPGKATFVLPATYAVGSTFDVVDESGFGIIIAQTLDGGAIQQVKDLGLASTAGVTGTTTSTIAGQSISLRAIVANGALRVVDNKGAFIYA